MRALSGSCINRTLTHLSPTLRTMGPWCVRYTVNVLRAIPVAVLYGTVMVETVIGRSPEP